MYGLVNRAIEDLITREFGADTWSEVAKAAEIDPPSFRAYESDPDSVTFSVVQAAASRLNVPTSQVLYLFGKHWINYTGSSGYDVLFEASGTDFEGFLRNLDGLHSRILLAMPNLKVPEFAVEPAGAPGHILLHYRSERSGLNSFVEGLLAGLGDRFGCDVQVCIDEPRSEEGHWVFDVHWTPREQAA